jgi:hypothetical protein
MLSAPKRPDRRHSKTAPASRALSALTAFAVLAGSITYLWSPSTPTQRKSNRHRPTTEGASTSVSGIPDEPSSTRAALYTAPGSIVPGERVPLQDEIPPWESTPLNTPTVSNVLPAWKVEAATPAFAPPPPPVVEPVNPALFRPPMDNPNGVNGDRPARISASDAIRPD